MAKGASLIARRLASGRGTGEIASEVCSALRRVPEVVADLDSENRRVKNAAIKILASVSENAPETVYGEIDRFLGYLDAPSNVLRWNAADIVCRLAAVDTKKMIGKSVLEKIFSFIDSESMVTAGHAVDGLWRVALARPRWRARITGELLRADDVPRDESCRAILAGKVLGSLAKYAEQVSDRAAMIDFAKKARRRYPEVIGKKADRFLKRFSG